MSQQYDLEKWGDLREALAQIHSRYGTVNSKTPGGEVIYSRRNRILYRGQSNSSWELTTTLERREKQPFVVSDYYLSVCACVHELESFTGRRWNVSAFPELQKEIAACGVPTRVHLPCYDFLVYLRHHGFPSPLLDWTESPFIAAYFAFCDKPEHERVAIYVYIENPRGSKISRGYPPTIEVQGPFTTTDPRHFAQKAWYTIATQWNPDTGHHVFCPHGSVKSPTDFEQDVIVKVTIPSSERHTALRELDDCNINHFTLFNSEDALVQALAIKCFDMKGN